MRRLMILTIATILISLPAVAGDCNHSEKRSGSLSLDGIEKVEVIARAGSLEVIGKSGLSTIRAKGEACASREKYLDDIRLRVTKRGSTAIVEVEIPRISSWGWTVSRSLDLVVEVPEGIAVDIDDSSGSMEVRNVGDLYIDDSSGGIEIYDISGEAEIRDGSGSITVTKVAGDVRINDGSGSIDIRDVDGSVIIEDDGSGSIDIENVLKDVIIEDDGSGSIYVSHVRGDFTVRDDGSGGIRFNDIDGRVRIPRD